MPPCVDADKISPGELAKLLTVSKQVDEWVDLLMVMESAEEELTMDVLKAKLEFLGQARAHRTLAKKPAGSPSAFEVGDLEAMLEDVPVEISQASSYPWSSGMPSEFISGIELLGRSVNIRRLHNSRCHLPAIIFTFIYG